MVKMKNRKGFSLLELVTVVAIMGIITGAVMLNVRQFTYPARVNTWKTSMNSLKDNLILYSTTIGGGSFPAPPTTPTNINEWLINSGAWFMDKRITNPFKGGMGVTVCPLSTGTLVPVDQATAPTDCVIIYACGPLNFGLDWGGRLTGQTGLTIENGLCTIHYQIGTKFTANTFGAP